MKIGQISKKIQRHEKDLRGKFHVKSLYVFGSVARGKASAKSDIDILVEFSSEDVGLFEFIELKNFLEDLFHTEVDLVTRDAIKSWMLADIEKDSIRVA